MEVRDSEKNRHFLDEIDEFLSQVKNPQFRVRIAVLFLPPLVDLVLSKSGAYRPFQIILKLLQITEEPENENQKNMEDAKNYSVCAALEVIEITECFDLSLKILEFRGKQKIEESAAPAVVSRLTNFLLKKLRQKKLVIVDEVGRFHLFFETKN